MPTESKRQLQAARNNTFLIRYIFVILIAFGFLVMVLFGSYVLLTRSKASSEALIAANDTKALAYSQTQAEIRLLSGNLSGAKAILDQQLLYSKALRLISQSMSPGTVIEKLTLNDSTFNDTPISLKVYATSADATVALREQFQSSGKFSGINIETIDEQGGIPGYPVSTTMTMTINRTAAQ